MRENSVAVASASFLLLAGAAITTAPAAQAGTPGGTHAADRNTDFNGDGYEHVLTGAPGATVGGHRGAGCVTVQYGSAKGITTTNRAVLSRNTPSVPGAAEAGDGFGKALASGDLDSDGYDDAIVGIPGEDIGTVADAGGIVILRGSPTARRSTTEPLPGPRARLTAGSPVPLALERAPGWTLEA
ncbi:FG-GAP repeat protein [Streptomyces scopuliridis]|uniref:FG-GAP repeat protein n=1 Tax=Streptomyces scopuliridis TaxID=452529 RepID=UPI00398CA6C0